MILDCEFREKHVDDQSGSSRSIRVLEVLEVVGKMGQPATAVDIENLSGLPKATVHRLCNLLIEEGYLRRDITGRGYELGERFSRLAVQAVSNQGQRSERHAILESVVRDIGETCNITVPSATSMLYLDRVESEWPLRIQLPPGSNVPLHCTASGKLFLATLPHARRERLIEKLQLEKKSVNTITDPTDLSVELDKIAASGIGTDNEEFIQGLVAVAVPIRAQNGRLVATLATHGPVIRMPFELALGHVDRLREAADELAKGLE
jgi:DNA-binding IclR family transcriptional regulator